MTKHDHTVFKHPPHKVASENNMTRHKLISAALLVTVLAGCATPTRQTDATMTPYDKDTEYALVPQPDGFTIAVNYSRYQFVPESGAVAIACKSALTAIAYEQADKRGRKIQPLNEQRIRISMGRNGLSGITSCSALAVAEWQK
jgi:hypothetical protein